MIIVITVSQILWSLLIVVVMWMWFAIWATQADRDRQKRLHSFPKPGKRSKEVERLLDLDEFENSIS